MDLSNAGQYRTDDRYPFQFPLDDDRIFASANPFATNFASYGRTTRGPEYHAAEDIINPAGTPVYAMADGSVSFSGRMKGYGWLIIIDHPQADLYSLYGHLSPSRWYIKKGSVKKGDLIGYLGDPDENGGSVKHPLRPHLHFGVRSGRRVQYPGAGEWRWQAGWIKPCPQDLGWLQPSLVITGQDVHHAQHNKGVWRFLFMWWIEMLFTGIYFIGGVSVSIFAFRKKAYLLMVIPGVVFGGIGWIMFAKSMFLSYLLFVMAGFLIVMGLFQMIRRPQNSQGNVQES